MQIMEQDLKSFALLFMAGKKAGLQLLVQRL